MLGTIFSVAGHVTRCLGPDIAESLKLAMRAPTMKEKMLAVPTIFALDPYILRDLILRTEVDKPSGGRLMPRDFDLWVRGCTELGNRGEGGPWLFYKRFPGSSLNAEPDKYGECPYGQWEVRQPVEPHFAARSIYPEQIAGMDELIDKYMADIVAEGKATEIGEITRPLVWDLYVLTTYGLAPSPETRRILQLFDETALEFDYAVRMSGVGIKYAWTDEFTAKVDEMNAWSIGVAKQRREAVAAGEADGMTDVLTTMLRECPHDDFSKMEGALRGVFTGGMNNMHAAVTGALIANTKNGGKVHAYLEGAGDDEEEYEKRMGHVLREALRLYTAIPFVRAVEEQDDFVVAGEKMEAGSSVLLSSYAVDTDPRSWDRPLEFDAARFEGVEETSYMMSKGFAPFGAAFDVGGRPCGARYHAEHMLRVIFGKLLRKYKFNEVGKSRGFEFKQNAGACIYVGKCIVKSSAL